MIMVLGALRLLLSELCSAVAPTSPGKCCVLRVKVTRLSTSEQTTRVRLSIPKASVSFPR
jgi:hypothetical protein